MPRLSWALLCQRVLTDQATNSVSYIEAVEAIRVRALPHPLPAVVVGCLWLGSDDEPFQFEVQLVDPEGEVVGKLTAEPQSLPADTGLRTNVALSGATVAVAGVFEVRVRQRRQGRWRTEAAIPLVVAVEEPE